MPTLQSKKRALPVALAKNAAKAAHAKEAEALAAARDDLALIRAKMELITDAFYDIGLALQRLARPGVAQLLKCKGFGDLVTRVVGLSVSSANDLIEIVTWVSRKDALTWRREKSAALVELAKATPAADTPATLMKGPIKLSSGRTFDARPADAKAIHEAAAEERQALAEMSAKPRRGVTTSKEERALGKHLERALRDAGLGEARVVVVARASGALLRIERVPAAKLDVLAKVTRAVHGGLKR